MDPKYPSRLNDYLHFPESDDDSDSDFDPEDYASSCTDDDEFEDSAEEDENDLSHLDPANVILGGMFPHEKGIKVPPKSAFVPIENKHSSEATRELTQNT